MCIRDRINSTVSSNSTSINNANGSGSQRGGGIYISGIGTAEIINSTISDNRTPDIQSSDEALSSGGGGIFNRGNLSLTNTTIQGNYSNYSGGGLYNASGLSGNPGGIADINQSTITGNASGVDPDSTGDQAAVSFIPPALH